MERPTDGEMVEVIDAAGRVVDVVARIEMRRRSLSHRCTYIFVVTPPERAGEPDRLVVHQRADWKDVYPSYWDLAFGGVCGVGEAWDSSARRELAEEAGITGVDLIDLGEARYHEGDALALGRAYVVFWDGPLRVDDGDGGEVVAVDTVAVPAVEAWVAQRSVCPDSAAALGLLLDYLDRLGHLDQRKGSRPTLQE